MYTKYETKGGNRMFLVTWIEGEEVKYRFINQQALSSLLASLGDHVIVQKLEPGKK